MNKKQFMKILTLICCAVTMLACGVLTACKDPTPVPPATSIPQADDDGEWTKNY